MAGPRTAIQNITARIIYCQWEMVSFVFQTCVMLESLLKVLIMNGSLEQQISPLLLVQTTLRLPQHKLTIDVSIRWYSTFLPLTATLVSQELQRNTQDIDTVDGNEISNAEDIIKWLSPPKTATRMLCHGEENKQCPKSTF